MMGEVRRNATGIILSTLLVSGILGVAWFRGLSLVRHKNMPGVHRMR